MATVPQSVTITPSVISTSSPAVKPAKPNQSFGFNDFLDIINPLQHIPVISTLYRRLTGDQMGPTAEIAGGALFGGLVGAVTSLADVIWTQATGKDFGNTALAWLGFDDKNSTTQLAKAEAPAASAPQLAAAEIPPVADLQIPAPAMPSQSDLAPDLPMLIEAMEKQGVDPDVALRAAAAYRSAIGLRGLPGFSAAPAF